MISTVTINNTKENTLEFDLSLEGITPQDLIVRFVIEAVGMEIAFACIKETTGKWKVDLPVLSILERTMYPFHFCVVADGYYFEPLRGNINVVGSAELYISQPKNIKILPAEKIEEIETEITDEEKKETKKEEEKKETKKEEEKKEDKKVKESTSHKKMQEKTIKEIAQELMEQSDFKPKDPSPKKKEAPPAIKSKDAVVKEILEQEGFPVKKKTKFSIR